MTLYRQEIIERWRFPRHRGAIENPDLQAEVVNTFCGDEVGLFIRLDSMRQSAAEVRFNGEGCALMIASVDVLCDAVEGKTIEALRGFKAEDLLGFYGEPPTPGRLRCVLLPYEALRRCLQVAGC